MALLKDGTRIYGTLYANTEVVIGSLNVSSQITTAFDKANSAGIAANTPSSVANAAYNHANAAFIAANTGTGATGAYNTANAAFIVANSAAIAANTPSSVANNSWNTANAAFIIANAAFAAANNVTPQIQPAFNTANAAFIAANTPSSIANAAFDHANAAFNAANTGGGGSSTDQFARNTSNAAFNHANAAFAAANTGGGGSSTDQFARDTANSKSYIFYQNTAPATSNSNDIWINTDNGASYENFGTPESPIWAEMGPTNAISNTPPGTLALSTLNILSHIAFTGDQRQTVPYQGYGIDNVARYTANSTAIRANNSLNANNGGTVTANVVVVGNVHANLFITTGSGGDISNANTVYSNSVSTGNVTVSTLVTAANVVVNNNITVKANSTVLGNSSINGILTVGGAFTVTGTANLTSLNINYAPATTTGAAISILAANTIGGTSYADVLKLTNNSAGTINKNKTIRLNNIGTLEVINNTYTSSIMSLDDSGNMYLPGNLTSAGVQSGYSANRPGFRVSGNGGSISATTTIAGGYMVVDFNQGSYLNTTTGIFTAPVAGLYQVNLVVRTFSNTNSGINQAYVVKNNSTIMFMIEFGVNTTMNHAGSSAVVQLAAGDTLKAVVSAGTISFDSNDNFSVAYIG